MAIVVKVSGPLFTHRWEALLDEGIKAAQASVAEYGVVEIHNELQDVLVENTGAYMSTIASEWETDDLAIHDGTVYGPWLEGLGSRNATSRFKGYWTFRVSTEKIRSKSNVLAVAAIAPFVEKINI